MGICTNDCVTREDDPVIGKDNVLDAHPLSAELIVVRDILLGCKTSHAFGQFGRLYVFIRSKVVGHKTDPVLIVDLLSAHLLENFDRRRSSYIIT